jgi:hypothetical protein
MAPQVIEQATTEAAEERAREERWTRWRDNARIEDKRAHRRAKMLALMLFGAWGVWLIVLLLRSGG